VQAAKPTVRWKRGFAVDIPAQFNIPMCPRGPTFGDGKILQRLLKWKSWEAAV